MATWTKFWRRQKASTHDLHRHSRPGLQHPRAWPQAGRQIGVAEQTLYRWRKEYGGMRVDQARRMKDLEAENVRLKKLVADLSLDKMILVEASRVVF
ncbi:MAG: hypothetical protein EXQ93_02740 [Alphaproteobacteria bacterium]|nr:hypothetical protein [Alphaproteobacteria bacterium]